MVAFGGLGPADARRGPTWPPRPWAGRCGITVAMENGRPRPPTPAHGARHAAGRRAWRTGPPRSSPDRRGRQCPRRSFATLHEDDWPRWWQRHTASRPGPAGRHYARPGDRGSTGRTKPLEDPTPWLIGLPRQTVAFAALVVDSPGNRGRATCGPKSWRGSQGGSSPARDASIGRRRRGPASRLCRNGLPPPLSASGARKAGVERSSGPAWTRKRRFCPRIRNALRSAAQVSSKYRRK